jgi:hypothetical protein
MATVDEIGEVRLKADEHDNSEPFTDDYLASLIDALGVNATIASVWRTKAARFAKLVDVTEAGASHKFSDLFKQASLMAAQWEADNVTETSGRPVVNSIVRT